MKCLLCDETLEESLNLLDYFLMKSVKPKICDQCRSRFQGLVGPVCPSCCKSEQEGVCEECLAWKTYHDIDMHHRSLYQYNEVMKDYFRRYKFFGDYMLRYVFAEELCQVLKADYKDYQIVPVPVSPERFQVRGFNQVTAMLEAGNIHWSEVFGKKEQGKQSSKNRQERLKTMQGFYVLEEAVLVDQLVIVDDIYTTGATLAYLIGLLKERGVTHIRTLSIAR